MMRYANLTNEQCSDIVEKVKKAGFLKLGDGLPTKIVICAEVQCLICGEALEIYTSGKSYQIACNKDGRIAVVRAFSNPAYFEEDSDD